MTRYITRRLLLLIPILIGGSFLIFALIYAMPGDPIAALAGDRPLSPAVVAQLRADYHLDDPLFIRYGKYVWALLHGDFGHDFAGRPVTSIIARRLPVTIQLAVVGIIFESLFGILAGVLAALKVGTFIDNLILISSTVLVSIPIFVIGFFMQYVFGYKLNWVPVAGIQDGWKSFILPGLSIAAISLAYVARLTRNSMLESMNSDYIRTARAKGVSRTRVILRHGLRNSLISVVTFIGADFGTLMGGAILTETVFNMPGLGRAIYEAVRNQEGQVVVGIVTMLIFFYVLCNLAVDILHAVLDPRVRLQ